MMRRYTAGVLYRFTPVSRYQPDQALAIMRVGTAATRSLARLALERILRRMCRFFNSALIRSPRSALRVGLALTQVSHDQQGLASHRELAPAGRRRASVAAQRVGARVISARVDTVIPDG
jgi:hypothetical protein